MAADRSDPRRAALEVLRDELAGGRYLMAPRNKKGRGTRDEGRVTGRAVPEPKTSPQPSSPPAPRPQPPAPEGGPPEGLASSRDAGLIDAKPLTDPAKSPGERLAELARLSEKCKQCELNKTRNKLVFGDGKPGAELLFVGEAPGADEDATGVPFVGRAGQLLNKIIAAMGLVRGEHVYICNVLKCRPPGNRTPLPSEAAECWPYLREQIEIVAPRVICALGSPAARTLLGTEETIGRLRGRVHDFRGTPLVATYHPAYLLRNPPEKAKVWEDMKLVLKLLGRPVPKPGKPQGGGQE